MFYGAMGVYALSNSMDYLDVLDICTKKNNTIAPLPDGRVW